MSDMVNKPPHYLCAEAFEVIDVIEAIPDSPVKYHLGNAVKYIMRAGKKEGSMAQDVAKAHWYLGRALKRMEKQQ